MTTDTSPLMRMLTALLAEAQQSNNTDLMKQISAKMREEQERIDREGLYPPPDPAYRVDLYEDNAGGLYLVEPDRRRGLTSIVSNGDDGGFADDAEFLGTDESIAGTVPTLPTPLVDLDTLTHIASYDGARGDVIVERDPASGRVVASGNGQRYIGITEE